MEKLLQTFPAQLNFERRRALGLFDECVKYQDTLRRRRVVKHPVNTILTSDAEFGYPGSHGWHWPGVRHGKFLSQLKPE
jgi:hypothetical protein